MSAFLLKSRKVFTQMPNKDWLFLSIKLLLAALSVALFFRADPAWSQRRLDDFFERVKKNNDPLLYNECTEKLGKVPEYGKAVLLITLKPEAYNIWLFEFGRGALILGTHVVLKGNEFEFIHAPGGHFTKARVRRIVQEQLQRPLRYLKPDNITQLSTSVPEIQCPEITPDDAMLKIPTEQ